MNELWYEIVNSNWKGYTKENLQPDQLLQPNWIQNILKQRDIHITLPLSTEAINELQSIRTIMQSMIEAFSTGHAPSDEDVSALNIYLAKVPAILQLEKKEKVFLLKELPLPSDWHWLLREVVASFAMFITSHNPACIKRCSNPDCRWVYYDESRQKNRRWCNDRCANLMRVRQFREIRKSNTSIHCEMDKMA